MLPIRNKVAIVGTGFSRIARRADVSVGKLAIEACERAVKDAGISMKDVDGLANYPRASLPGVPTEDGVTMVSVNFMARTLRLPNLRWYCSITQGTITASLIEAVNAVAAGACDYALVWRAMATPRIAKAGYTGGEAAGSEQFIAPYGFSHNLMNFALPYARYMGKYGATREHMASYIVNNRQNAALNPDAVFYGRPISRQEYLDSEIIAEPLSTLDCDMPVDGCGALVVTSAERARELPTQPVYVTGYAGLGLEYSHGLSWYAPLMNLESYRDAAARVARVLWDSSGLSPKDIDVAMLYDGFSYFIYLWLEEFGFCKEGEAFEFIQDGRVALGGQLPLNTSGGALGMGRLHGTPQLIEGIRQLQGRCGPRQVPGAEVALVHSGGPITGCAALTLGRSIS